MGSSTLLLPGAAHVGERQPRGQVRAAAEDDEHGENEDEREQEDDVGRDVDACDLRPVSERERDSEQERADDSPEWTPAGKHREHDRDEAATADERVLEETGRDDREIGAP